MKYFLLPFLFLCLFACDTKKATKGDGTCKTEATVKDFTGLDGCRLMLVLADGKKLLPGDAIEMDFDLADGQKVLLNYTVLKDAVSACMAEDMIIKIDCIELVK